MSTFFCLVQNLSDELFWEVGRQYKEELSGFYLTIDDCMQKSDVQNNNLIIQVTTDTPLSQIESFFSDTTLSSFTMVDVRSIQSWIMQFPLHVLHQMDAAFIRHIPAEKQDKIMWHKASAAHHPEWILNPEGVKWLQQYHTHRRCIEVQKDIDTLRAELQKKELEQQMLKSLAEPNFQF